MTTILERRVAAAQATLDHFSGQEFVWGVRDCATMAAFHLRQLGRMTPLRSFGVYRTARGAKRALLRKGFSGLDAVLDSLGLARIAPASVLPGDILGLPDDDGAVSLAISIGNGRILGFLAVEGSGTARAGPLQPAIILTAWRSI
jgi:hypothetical protein